MRKQILYCFVAIACFASCTSQKDTDENKRKTAEEYLRKNPEEGIKLISEVYSDTTSHEEKTFPVNLEQANQWINSLPNGAPLTKKSFLIKLDTLDAYLNNLRTSANGTEINREEIKYLHVFLGTTNAARPDSTTIIISAVDVVTDNAGKSIGEHVYSYDSDGNAKVLEHTIPCPKCIDGNIKVHEKIMNDDVISDHSH